MLPKQLISQVPYWWPTIAEDLLLFITLCTSCQGKGDELPTEEGSHKPSTSKGVIPYKETSNDWRAPLIKYMTHGEFKIGTITRREQREIIWKSQYFTLEKAKLIRLERSGMTKECIAGSQIKNWIREMHIYQKRHLMLIKLGVGCLKEINGGLWWVFATYKIFIRYDFPICRETFKKNPVT